MNFIQNLKSKLSGKMLAKLMYLVLVVFLAGVILVGVIFVSVLLEVKGNVVEYTEETTVLTEQDSELYDEFEDSDLEDGEKPLPRRSLKPIDENSVYYGKTNKDLYIDYVSDDYAIGLLKSISSVYYGTAGCELDTCIDGYYFLLLSQLPEEQWSEIPAFLDSLTPEQIDFLSYRVFVTYNYGFAIIERESILTNLDSVGIDPETYQDCSAVQAVKFLTYMMNLFNERNVNYEWGEYNVLSVFY